MTNLDIVNYPRRSTASSRSRRAGQRGQAIIELALIAPIFVVFVLVIASFWVHYQRMAAYTSGAQTLAEWIARTGQYTPSMGDEIQVSLDQSFGVDSANSYLTVIILDGVGGTILDSTGSTVPSSGPAVAPGDTGWNGSLSGVVDGQFIQVDIWGYSTIGSDGGGPGTTFVPDGHAVHRSMFVETSP